MKRLAACLVLSASLVRALATAALATTRTILREPTAPRRGFATLRYDGLDERGAALLGALITLTPGTSTIAVDTQRRELRLHLLDTAELDATLEAIRRDFLEPLQILFGSMQR